MNMLTPTSLGLSLFVFAGCSVTAGRFGDETHFSFPNSNVQPLGHVTSTMSRWSFFVSPLGKDDALVLLKDALTQKPGADLVLNYTLDTKITLFPIFIYKADITLDGTAAKMEVGEQKLKPVLDKVRYAPVE